jgi:hypothetical protein
MGFGRRDKPDRVYKYTEAEVNKIVEETWIKVKLI